VTVDPAQSPVTLQFGQPAPAGMLGVQISLRPRSSNGEFLGPFRDGSVRMVAEGGVLQGLIGHYDGTYTNVLYYKPGEVPKVGITVGGVRFPPEVISPNPICRKLGRLPRLYEELIEELEDLICCRHGKRKGFLHELLEYLEKLEEKSPIAHHLIDKLRRLFRLG